jgi:hypothetical protein
MPIRYCPNPECGYLLDRRERVSRSCKRCGQPFPAVPSDRNRLQVNSPRRALRLRLLALGAAGLGTALHLGALTLLLPVWCHLGGFALALAGCAVYARLKGFSALFALLGLLSVLGLVILVAVPDE